MVEQTLDLIELPEVAANVNTTLSETSRDLGLTRPSSP